VLRAQPTSPAGPSRDACALPSHPPRDLPPSPHLDGDRGRQKTTRRRPPRGNATGRGSGRWPCCLLPFPITHTGTRLHVRRRPLASSFEMARSRIWWMRVVINAKRCAISPTEEHRSPVLSELLPNHLISGGTPN